MHKTEEFYLNMGPQHPSTHGVLKLVLTIDGELVKEAQPEIGFLHRALEKIAENRTYHQYVPYTDRLDYVTSMTSNFVYVLAVEKLAGIKVPPRAEHIRIIMAELNRIASHLLWLGAIGLEAGATTPFLYTFRERELILDLFEMTCGARLTYNYMRIGGVSRDITPTFIEKTKEFLQIFRPCIKEYEDLLIKNVIFHHRVKGIGVLTAGKAVALGVTGPNIRAAGMKWDLRKDIPYSIYRDFEFDIPTRTDGDTLDRILVRVEEMRQSCRIIEQAIEKLPKGDVQTFVPLHLEPPAGEVFMRTESPRGELSCFILSDGSEKPYRLKFRSPSFSHVSALPTVLRGLYMADVVIVGGSFDIVLPETDR
ncbi:MAG: NADH-quinone oxidoreductase subunit D [Candidatus Eremiobacteraeota bacterium]|nr:NADH-quinone oxidoreductase subunit D [Candidatus Eremiobacteraeota bacterium]